MTIHREHVCEIESRVEGGWRSVCSCGLVSAWVADLETAEQRVSDHVLAQLYRREEQS